MFISEQDSKEIDIHLNYISLESIDSGKYIDMSSDEIQELLWDSVQDNIIRIIQEHRIEGIL
jgi:hypothetical protein